MKTSALTIRLDPELEKRLERAAARSGRSRSEIVREALRRQLALAQFDDLRKRMMPFAEAAGYLTDEDVFRDVSGIEQRRAKIQIQHITEIICKLHQQRLVQPKLLVNGVLGGL